MIGLIGSYSPSMRCESNIKIPQRPSGHRPRLASLVSRARPAGELAGFFDRFTPATPSLSFGGGLRSAGGGSHGLIKKKVKVIHAFLVWVRVFFHQGMFLLIVSLQDYLLKPFCLV